MQRNVFIDFGYLVFLAASFGAVVVLGAFVAPVIFHADDIFVVLDHYSSGILMTEIFRKFSYWLYALASAIALYEMVAYKYGGRDKFVLISAVSAVFSALMFSGVYLPKIVSMQNLGVEATQSDTFAGIHAASEFDFKILAIALLILFIRRLMLLRIR